MTWQGWLQILVYFAVLTALVPVRGGYMARVYSGQRVALERVLGPVERLFYRAVRTDPERGREWGRAAGPGWLGAVLPGAVRAPAAAGRPAVHPAAVLRGAVERHLQHDLVVCHQHQLAVLRRRDDDVASVPDGRADGAEHRLRRGRDGGAGRGRP